MVSGQLGLTALKFIQSSTNSIVAVLSDTASVEIRNYCEINKIPIFLGNPRKGKAVDFLSKLNCDLLLSINYLYIIEQDLISLPKEYAINFHGSLLPKYRGRTPHVWAIINGETQTGVTAHLIDQNMDSGDIIHQIPIEINPEATGADLLKLFHIVYPELISKVLSNVNKRTLTYDPKIIQKPFILIGALQRMVKSIGIGAKSGYETGLELSQNHILGLLHTMIILS